MSTGRFTEGAKDYPEVFRQSDQFEDASTTPYVEESEYNYAVSELERAIQVLQSALDEQIAEANHWFTKWADRNKKAPSKEVIDATLAATNLAHHIQKDVKAQSDVMERMLILQDHPNMWAAYAEVYLSHPENETTPSECADDDIQDFWNWLEPIMEDEEGRKIWHTELKADEYQRFDGGAG